jgi:YesN/AraC family two-component response regulator
MSKEYSFKSSNIFFRYLDDRIPLNVVPLVVGYENCAASKEIIGPTQKSIYTLHIVIKGCGYFHVGDTKYTVKANQIFAIIPSERISYYPDKKNPWQYMWIEFNGLGVKNLCERANVNAAHPVHTLQNPKAYIEEFSNMLEEAKDSKIHSTLNVLSSLLRIFSMLINERENKESQNLNEAESRMKAIVEFIEQNIGDSSLSLDKVSKLFYINPSYLSRKFKEVMGVNMSKYITSLRMRKAFIMLKTRQFSVAKIAETIGYSSPFYFSKEFKRYAKISPKQYIEEHADH